MGTGCGRTVRSCYPRAPMSTDVTLDLIRAARERISPSIARTPLAASGNLSAICGNRIYCKLENLNVTVSFKERGALNMLHETAAPEKKAGVIAASAGNH